VEAWLYELLCLNAAEHVPKPPPQLPHPSECELYYVERDTLFSFHKVTDGLVPAALQGTTGLSCSEHDSSKT
jgi:tRNA(Met) C34 N-acetyltransferase TmcA